jgi:hypothetical protein
VLAPVSLRRSPHVLHRRRLDHRVFTRCGCLAALPQLQPLSHGLAFSFRVLQTPSRRPSLPTAASSCRSFRPTPPMRFFAPSASPRTKQRLIAQGLHPRTTYAHRFSQPLDALLRPVPAGLVSCQIRSWGCTLQSLVPLAWPHAVSGAVPLMTFQHTPKHHCQLRSLAPKRGPRCADGSRPAGLRPKPNTAHRSPRRISPPRRSCRNTRCAETTAGAPRSRRSRNRFASKTFLTATDRPAPKR